VVGEVLPHSSYFMISSQESVTRAIKYILSNTLVSTLFGRVPGFDPILSTCTLGESGGKSSIPMYLSHNDSCLIIYDSLTPFCLSRQTFL
jgi:hypothetical protein